MTLTTWPDPIRPARRAAQLRSPAFAPLSAARSRAPGRHAEGHAFGM